MKKTIKKANILYLECRGCYFNENDEICNLSDVGNHRVGAYKHRIVAKDGNAYILEFGAYDRKEMRYTALRTGKPLKHPKYETTLKNALHVNTEYKKQENGYSSSWRNCELEKEIHDKKFSFTKSGILKAVNAISVKQYDKIVLLSDENIIDILPAIYQLGGFREKAILDNLSEVKTKQYSKNYHVYSLISENGDSFDFEAISGKITG